MKKIITNRKERERERFKIIIKKECKRDKYRECTISPYWREEKTGPQKVKRHQL